MRKKGLVKQGLAVLLSLSMGLGPCAPGRFAVLADTPGVSFEVETDTGEAGTDTEEEAGSQGEDEASEENTEEAAEDSVSTGDGAGEETSGDDAGEASEDDGKDQGASNQGVEQQDIGESDGESEEAGDSGAGGESASEDSDDGAEDGEKVPGDEDDPEAGSGDEVDPSGEDNEDGTAEDGSASATDLENEGGVSAPDQKEENTVPEEEAAASGTAASEAETAAAEAETVDAAENDEAEAEGEVKNSEDRHVLQAEVNGTSISVVYDDGVFPENVKLEVRRVDEGSAELEEISEVIRETLDREETKINSDDTGTEETGEIEETEAADPVASGRYLDAFELRVLDKEENEVRPDTDAGKVYIRFYNLEYPVDENGEVFDLCEFTVFGLKETEEKRIRELTQVKGQDLFPSEDGDAAEGAVFNDIDSQDEKEENGNSGASFTAQFSDYDYVVIRWEADEAITGSPRFLKTQPEDTNCRIRFSYGEQALWEDGSGYSFVYVDTYYAVSCIMGASYDLAVRSAPTSFTISREKGEPLGIAIAYPDYDITLVSGRRVRMLGWKGSNGEMLPLDQTKDYIAHEDVLFEMQYEEIPVVYIYWGINPDGVLKISSEPLSAEYSGGQFETFREFFEKEKQAPWYEKRETIRQVITEGGTGRIKPDSAAYWFKDLSAVTSIDLSGMDASGISDFRYMFSECRNLKSIDFSGFNTEKAENFTGMFYYCRNLDLPDVSVFHLERTGLEVDDMFYGVPFRVESRTEDEIKEYYSSHPFSGKDSWKTSPNAASETAGVLSQETRQRSLNALNFIRFIAGVLEAEYSTEYEYYCQAGTTLLQLVGYLDHHPSKPAGVSTAFYKNGYQGTSHSNLGFSIPESTIADMILFGWMSDEDSKNIRDVGHRRWCLDPRIRKYGFGHSGYYTAMYFEESDPDFSHRSYEYIPWPAGETPVEYFYGPWSVSVNGFFYRPGPNGVQVRMHNKTDGKTYTITEKDKDYTENGKFFELSPMVAGYGSTYVFQPGVKFDAYDEIEVQITGLQDIRGEASAISYTVDFFSIGDEHSDADVEKMKQFLERLYKTCLSREADSDGLSYWTGRIRSGNIKGIEIAGSFVFSTEFTKKNYCNEHFVKQIYPALMGREADAGGLAYWVGQLDSGKMNRESLLNSFASSAEYKNLCNNAGIELGAARKVPKYGVLPYGPCAVCGEKTKVVQFVERMYTECLKRSAESGGLNYWSKELCNHTKTGKSMLDFFFLSKEIKQQNLSNEEYVKRIYRAMLNREPDSGGLDFWAGELNKGKQATAVIAGFVNSEEFTKICQDYGIHRK